MFTIKQIKNGQGYFTKYLSVKNYYAPEQEGYWVGNGAKLMGLDGEIRDDDFIAISNNKHPGTGAKITQRALQNNLHDITYSAPKAVSILAVMVEDERVVAAFKKSVEYAHKLLEERAAVRVRSGANYNTENVHYTRNMTTAVFIHDDSRALNPQLHAHLVSGNFSYDAKREKWYALQTRFMMEESNLSIRSLVNERLKNDLVELGFPASIRNGTIKIGFISDEMERKLSERSVQRDDFKKRYREMFGADPSKKRVEQFIKDSKELATSRFISEYQGKHDKSPAPETTRAFIVDWRGQKQNDISDGERRALQFERWTASERYQFEHAMKMTKGNNRSDMFMGQEKEKQTEKQSMDAEEPRDYHKQDTPSPLQFGVGTKKTKRKRRKVAKCYSALRRGQALAAAMGGNPALALLHLSRQRAQTVRQKR